MRRRGPLLLVVVIALLVAPVGLGALLRAQVDDDATLASLRELARLPAPLLLGAHDDVLARVQALEQSLAKQRRDARRVLRAELAAAAVDRLWGEPDVELAALLEQGQKLHDAARRLGPSSAGIAMLEAPLVDIRQQLDQAKLPEPPPDDRALATLINQRTADARAGELGRLAALAEKRGRALLRSSRASLLVAGELAPLADPAAASQRTAVGQRWPPLAPVTVLLEGHALEPDGALAAYLHGDDGAFLKQAQKHVRGAPKPEVSAAGARALLEDLERRVGRARGDLAVLDAGERRARLPGLREEIIEAWRAVLARPGALQHFSDGRWRTVRHRLDDAAAQAWQVVEGKLLARFVAAKLDADEHFPALLSMKRALDVETEKLDYDAISQTLREALASILEPSPPPRAALLGEQEVQLRPERVKQMRAELARLWRTANEAIRMRQDIAALDKRIKPVFFDAWADAEDELMNTAMARLENRFGVLAEMLAIFRSPEQNLRRRMDAVSLAVEAHIAREEPPEVLKEALKKSATFRKGLAEIEYRKR